MRLEGIGVAPEGAQLHKDKYENDTATQNVLTDWWHILDFVTGKGFMTKVEYLSVAVVIARSVLQSKGIEINVNQVSYHLLKDWEHDTQGAAGLSKEMFFRSVAELGAIWCEGSEASDMVKFLNATLEEVKQSFQDFLPGGSKRGGPKRDSILRQLNKEKQSLAHRNRATEEPPSPTSNEPTIAVIDINSEVQHVPSEIPKGPLVMAPLRPPAPYFSPTRRKMLTTVPPRPSSSTPPPRAQPTPPLKPQPTPSATPPLTPFTLTRPAGATPSPRPSSPRSNAKPAIQGTAAVIINANVQKSAAATPEATDPMPLCLPRDVELSRAQVMDPAHIDPGKYNFPGSVLMSRERVISARVDRPKSPPRPHATSAGGPATIIPTAPPSPSPQPLEEHEIQNLRHSLQTTGIVPGSLIYAPSWEPISPRGQANGNGLSYPGTDPTCNTAFPSRGARRPYSANVKNGTVIPAGTTAARSTPPPTTRAGPGPTTAADVYNSANSYITSTFTTNYEHRHHPSSPPARRESTFHLNNQKQQEGRTMLIISKPAVSKPAGRERTPTGDRSKGHKTAPLNVYDPRSGVNGGKPGMNSDSAFPTVHIDLSGVLRRLEGENEINLTRTKMEDVLTGPIKVKSWSSDADPALDTPKKVTPRRHEERPTEPSIGRSQSPLAELTERVDVMLRDGDGGFSELLTATAAAIEKTTAARSPLSSPKRPRPAVQSPGRPARRPVAKDYSVQAHVNVTARAVAQKGMQEDNAQHTGLKQQSFTGLKQQSFGRNAPSPVPSPRNVVEEKVVHMNPKFVPENMVVHVPSSFKS